MPIRALLCPDTGDEIPLDRAADYFDERGIMPSYEVRAIVAKEGRVRDDPTRLYPTAMNPDVTCRREVVMKAFDEYVLDPRVLMTAYEGTFNHALMKLWGDGDPRRVYEVRVPAEEGTAIELWGLPISMRIDEIEDGEVIRDLKTSRYSRKDNSHFKIDEWAVQLGLYRLGYEKQNPGTSIKGLWVWRKYLGSYDHTATYKKFLVPMYGEERLRAKVQEFSVSLRAFLIAAQTVKQDGGDLDETFRQVPMDGYDKQMFGGSKCDKYCVMRDRCFGLAGKTVF